MSENETLNAPERLEFIGDQAEKNISLGKDVIISEEDRMWLKERLEKYNLKDMEGNAVLAEQAAKVFEILGKDKAIKLTATVVMEMLSDHGNVFGKGNSGNPEEVGIFVEAYLGEQISKDKFIFDPKQYKGDGDPGSNWKMNTVYRIEAVLSVVNKLLLIIGADDEGDAKKKQKSDSVKKHLCERVIRGKERAGETIGEGVPRIDEKIIRFLPKSGLAKIFVQILKD